MRIVAAMSGGVDSSVAAALLAEQGHEVIGVSMQLYDQTDGHRSFGSCCTLDDLHDARRVARAIDIPHYILNFERQFDEQVVSNFVNEYASGRTPLPCAHCNSDMKFSTLLERACGFGADRVATGHYARVDYDAGAGRYVLRRGVDATKDQSYFLFSLTQEQLARAVFPVGDRPKEAVRAYARSRNLPVADKPDSQEICFIPDNDYAAFVTAHAPHAARAQGPIVDESGRVLGRHEGIHRFTVGQRKGLGLAGLSGLSGLPGLPGVSGTSGGAPVYVLAIHAADRRVVVGPKSSLERTTLTASEVNWMMREPAGALRVTAQIRHRHLPAPATVRVVEPGCSTRGGQAELVFDAPQIAVTPGQAVVFYQDDVVVGGGWID
jgi:tRNA-specific 2-thiouridylase